MKVKIKFYAQLGEFLPANANANEAEVDINDDMSVQQVIDAYSIPKEYCHLVLVNGSYVEPSNRGGYKMSEGDHLAIWPPIAGG